MHSPLTEIQLRVLNAMFRVRGESTARKSVVILRYALLELNCWDDEVESALCNGGVEHPEVARHYRALQSLVHDTPFAKGAGDLRLPAGPRYTECWITQSGIDYLNGLYDDR